MNKYLEKIAAARKTTKAMKTTAKTSNKSKTEVQPGMKKHTPSKQFMKLKVKIDKASQRKKHVK